MRELTPFDDSQFVILKRVRGVPVMAGCKLCEYKFFALSTLLTDAVRAKNYLRQKFMEHKCSSRNDDWERRFCF